MDSGELIRILHIQQDLFQICWNIKYSDLLPLTWSDIPIDQDLYLYKHEIWSFNFLGHPTIHCFGTAMVNNKNNSNQIGVIVLKLSPENRNCIKIDHAMLITKNFTVSLLC